MNTETPRIDFTERSMSWTAPPVGTGPVRFGLVRLCHSITKHEECHNQCFYIITLAMQLYKLEIHTGLMRGLK